MHGSGTGRAEDDLLDPARQMRWRVPELTLLLGDRLTAQARLAGDRPLRLRAETLALFASNRLGRSIAVTERAIAAAHDAAEGRAGVPDESLPELRIELACCARVAGSAQTALRLLEPVLAQDRLDPSSRAHALIELSAALPLDSRGSERAEACSEAERLYGAAPELDEDTAKLLRARVFAVRAGHARRDGAVADVLAIAESGLELLAAMTDPETDSGEVRSLLVLERTHALLDLGRHDAAVAAANELLNRPVRAAAAKSVGWLRLAVATRVHLPAGDHDAALRLLAESSVDAERHHCGEVHAESLSVLSQVYERTAEYEAALRCLREANGIDRRCRTAAHTARVRVLEEFPRMAVQAVVPQQGRHTEQVREPEMPPAESTPAVPAQQSLPEQDSARAAAKRLMETLTGTAASRVESSVTESVAEVSEPDDEFTAGSGWQVTEENRMFGGPGPMIGQSSPPAAETTPEHEDAGGEAPGGEPDGERVSAGSDEPMAFSSFAEHILATLAEDSTDDRSPAEPAQFEPAPSESDSWQDWWPRSPADSPPSEPALPGQGPGLLAAAFGFSAEGDGAVPSSSESGGVAEPDGPVMEHAVADEPRAWFQPEHAHDESAERAEVTAIMPVIATPPADPVVPDPSVHAPANLGTQSASTRGEEPEPLDTESSVESFAPAASTGAFAAAEQAAPGTDDQPGQGRRSRGKSLAEIRAGLRRVPDTPAPGTGGRRRRTEPDDEPLDDEPPAHEPTVGESAAANAQAQAPVQRPLRAVDSGDQSRAGLADLLTEALMAYETGRRGETVAEDERRTGTEPGGYASNRVAGITLGSETGNASVGGGASRAAESDEGRATRARHRHDGPEQHTWTPRVR